MNSAIVCITNCTKHKGNPLHLSPMAAGVELPALLQLIQEKVQFVMHTLRLDKLKTTSVTLPLLLRITC